MPMNELIDFVARHTTTHAGCDDVGECADMVFFKVVSKDDPDPEVLRRLLRENLEGAFDKLDMLDNAEHSYIQVGGWIGDQGTALRLMGLGWLLKLWQCMTPRMLSGLPEDLIQQMAGVGYVSLIPDPNR